MTDWKPIETAPKDGTVIDIWHPLYPDPSSGHRMAEVKWSNEQGWNDGYYIHIHATHWMPLPEPPK